MATFQRNIPTRSALPAPAPNVSNWTVDDIRKSDILVFRQSRNDYIDTVVAPNGFQVGLLDEAFLTDLLVTGHITGSGVIYSELGFSGSLQTLVDGSDYLRAGSNVTITKNADGSITIAAATQAASGTNYTAGTALSLAGNQFNVDKDGTTISTNSSGQLEALKVPNALSTGNGLNTISYDGSNARTITVQPVSGSPVTVSASGIGFEITTQNALSLSATDELIIQKGSNLGKITMQDILNLVPSADTVVNEAYLVAQSSSSLTNERVLTAGTGVEVVDSSGLGTMTVSVALETSGGLQFVSGKLAIKVADFAGFGLSESSGNLSVTPSSFAGIGLSASGNQLNVNFGTGTNQAAMGTNTISVNAGDGLSLGGTATIGHANNTINLEVRTEDFSGVGTSVNNNNLNVYLAGANGITITTGSNGELVIDGQNVQGTGAAGVIGNPEDGNFNDGLFTDFTSTTPTGTAVDRFNEILKFLTPNSAPVLSKIDADTAAGVNALVSFGTSNAIAGISNVVTNDDFSGINVNGAYNSGTSSNGHIKLGVYGTAVDIIGDLAPSVAQTTIFNSEVNYPAKAFGKANQGNLVLELNGVNIYTLDLTNNSTGAGIAGSGSGSHLNSDSGFIQLSAATNGKYNSGQAFENEKHRTGKYKVAAASQRRGYNYLKVKHVIGSTTYTTNHVQWILDDVATAGQITLGSGALGSLSMAGSKHLSGVKYHTSGTANYSISVGNFYKNVYSTSPITIDSAEIAQVSVNPPTINTGASEDHNRTINISTTVTIDSNLLLDVPISANINISHPTKNDVSSGGAASFGKLLLYNIAEANTETLKTIENFDGETNRLATNAFETQTSVNSNSYDSTVSLVGNSGLQVWNRKLIAPIKSTNSGNFSSIINGPTGNPDYSGLTTGSKTYYRKFTNNSGGAVSNFTITIDGTGTIVSNSGTLSGNNFKMFMKLPGPATNKTGWLDVTIPFEIDNYADNDGCLVDTLDTSLNSIILGTIGTKFVENNEHIVIKIVADGSWTGYVDELRITWR